MHISKLLVNGIVVCLEICFFGLHYIPNLCVFMLCFAGYPGVKWRIVLIATAVSWSRLIIEKEVSC